MKKNECGAIDEHEIARSLWTMRLFALSLFMLGAVLLLQSTGIIRVTENANQDVKPKPMRAGGLYCADTIWNFGVVDSVKNPSLSHEFTLVNESQETISIKKVHSTCGCMVAEGYDKALLPGTSTKLTVAVQLPPTPQLFHKSLAVQATKGILPLGVRGEISANNSLYSVPAKINFGTIKLGETKERTVQILRYDLSPIVFEKTEGSSAELTCETVNSAIFQVTLNVSMTTGPSLLSGAFEGHVIVHTTAETPLLSIPVSAIVTDIDYEESVLD